MLEPPQWRKPTTELEAKPVRGGATEVDDLILRLDRVLHADLWILYRRSIPDDEREKIVVGVIADFIYDRVGHDADRGTEETLAKAIARRRAIDYLRHAEVVERARPNVKRREEVLRSVSLPDAPMAKADEAEEQGRRLERVTAEIEQLPRNLRRAALAYMRHGDSDPRFGGKAYSTILAEELGVEAGLVAQWWCRARSRLREALGVESAVGKKRSKV